MKLTFISDMLDNATASDGVLNDNID